MRWGMVINVSKCARCYGCLVACKVEHFLPMGVSWPRLVAFEPDGVDPEVSTYPVRCNQCKNAPCIKVCPTGANRQREDGIVRVDHNRCVGCRYCVVACPYQNRTFLSKDKDRGYYPGTVTGFEKMGKKLYPHQVGTTEKCNFCMERIDAGLAQGLAPGLDRAATPACVNACQARAMTFGDLDHPESEVSVLLEKHRAFQLHPEYGTDPSVFYIDPKPWAPPSDLEEAEESKILAEVQV